MRFSIVYKLSLSTVLLVLVSVGVVGGVFYTKTMELLVEIALEDIAVEINNAGRRLQEHIKGQGEDILFLYNAPPVQGLLRAQNTGNYDKQGKSTHKQWAQRLELIFTAFLESKPSYLKLRFIDKQGQEIVVVGREGDKIVALSNERLQNKAHRTYMRDTLMLPAGEIYLSSINLNREHGKVSEPHQEVLRSATPVYDDRNGEVAGIVLITAEIGHTLFDIQNDIQDVGSTIYITNDHGGYLLHPDASKTYGFDLGKRYRIQEDIPQLARMFLPDNQQLNFILRPEDTDGQNVMNFTLIALDPDRPERFIAVGITQLYSNIEEKQIGVLGNVLRLSLVLAVAVMLLAIVFAYRVSRPIKQITQVIEDYANQRETTAVMPVNHSDEIGVLARSYEALIRQVELGRKDLEEVNSGLEVIVAERTRELESSELYQRSIVENIVDGLVTIDDKGIVTSFNPAAVKIFGYQPDEVIGNNIKMLMPDPYQSEHDGYLDDYHKTNEKKIIGIGREVEGQCKDGSTFPMDLAVNEVDIDDTHFFIGIVRNITERKQSERAMVEAKELAEKNNQMKSEFLNMMSHELRTPLTVIIGYLPLLKNEATMPEPAMVADIAQDMDSAGKHLLALINDVLDLSKIEAGKMSLRCEEIPLRPFTEDFLNNLRVSTNAKGVSLICEADEGVLYADPVRLKQILINLVGNAIKFTHHGSVTVSVRKVDGGAEFKVIDTGSGMPEEDLPFIFDKFHQIDSSSTRNIGGTGLGLSITKQLIELHGGEVTVMSKPGEGAVFTFTILNQEMDQNG